MTSTARPPRHSSPLWARWIDTADLRARQWGFITSGQSGRLGVDLTQQKRLRQRGMLKAVAYGVMREPDRSDDEGVLADARLAWVNAGKDLFPEERLAAGWPDYVVTATTALAIHGLAEPAGELPQLAHTRARWPRYQLSTADVITVEVPVTWDEVSLLDGLPVATPATAIATLVSTEPPLVDDLASYLDTVAAAATERPDLRKIVQAIAKYNASP